jgi:hypothetical protein
MSTSPVFSRWLEIVSADEEITVCPEDIHHEAVSNHVRRKKHAARKEAA